MAILYREITFEKKNKYSIEEYDSSKCVKVADIFKEKLSIATVNGALGFFLNIGKEYLATMQYSFNKKNKMKGTKQQNSNLVESGVGME